MTAQLNQTRFNMEHSVVLEAVTHEYGPKLNGIYKKREFICNIRQTKLLTTGYLRKNDFYPLDIAKIIAKFMNDGGRFIMNFKREPADIIDGKDHKEGNTRSLVLFTPNIKQLPFVAKKIINNNKSDDTFSDSCYFDFDLKMTKHVCRDGYYNTDGYYIQAAIVRIPKQLDYNEIVNNFSRIADDFDETTRVEFHSLKKLLQSQLEQRLLEQKKQTQTKESDDKDEDNENDKDKDKDNDKDKDRDKNSSNVNAEKEKEMQDDKMKLYSKIESIILTCTLYSKGKWIYAALGKDETQRAETYLWQQSKNKISSNLERYILQTNDSITMSIERSCRCKDDGEKSSVTLKTKADTQYLYSLYWLKNGDDDQVLNSMELDCDNYHYLLGMASSRCYCPNTDGFEWEVIVSDSQSNNQ